jgi:TFIIIC subunit triple barrel domain
LSTVNGIIKARRPKRRGGRKPKKSKPAELEDSDDEDSAEDADAAEPEQEGAQGGDSQIANTDNPNIQPPGKLQILDIGTGNPIISHQKQLYTCTWSDMIGTNMFFTRPADSISETSIQSTPDFELLGTSRIKLVGRKTKMVPKSKSRKRPFDDEDGMQDAGGEADPINGSTFPGFGVTNPKKNLERRKQAKFLERLMRAKRARGETDMVPTIPHGINHSRATLTAEQKQRINTISMKIVKGDAEAVASLKEIYSQLNGAQEPNPGLGEIPNIPTPGPARSDQNTSNHG